MRNKGIKNKVSNGENIEGLDLSENNFWFAHPVYFMNYLYEEGLLTEPRIRNLLKVQDEVVAMPCLRPNTRERAGGLGIYKQGGDTFCNHAIYLTIKAVDKIYKNFTGFTTLYRDNEVPWSIEKLIHPFTGFHEGYTNYPYKNTNIWCDILEEQANRGNLIKINEVQSQEYANMGYLVIGAWKNMKITPKPENNPPHYASVRSGFEYGSKEGLKLANVGENNGIEYVIDSFFTDERRDDIKWYYNPNQDFNYHIQFVLRYLNHK